MSMNKLSKPKLLSNYYVWCEPPGEDGDEVLYFVSARKRIKIKGHSFREFRDAVLPLLDGTHSIEEIEKEVAHLFKPEDLRACIDLLLDQSLLVEADSDLTFLRDLPQPQLNFLHEFGPSVGDLQRRLSCATVAVVGLGGVGALTAMSLAAARLGFLRLIDSLPITKADTYFSTIYSQDRSPALRAASIADSIRSFLPGTKVAVHTTALNSDLDVESAIDGSDFVLCCVDRGQSAIAYKLNRVCLKRNIRWTSGLLRGTEVILGPTVYPEESPCYLCYRMRAVACAGNPEDEFTYERFLDRRKQDDSERHENIVCGANLLAGLVGMEALKVLTGLAEPSAVGKIIVLNLLDLSTTKHTILRKPWCPACFRGEEKAARVEA